MDKELHWVWCGNEGSAVLRGPFLAREDAERNVLNAVYCDHHHAIWAATPEMVARSLPRDCRWDDLAVVNAKGDMIVDGFTFLASGPGFLDLTDALAARTCVPR